MPDAPKPSQVTPIQPLLAPRPAVAAERMVCERCGGAEVYRIHAVWRCAECGFKTDCCGW